MAPGIPTEAEVAAWPLPLAGLVKQLAELQRQPTKDDSTLDVGEHALNRAVALESEVAALRDKLEETLHEVGTLRGAVGSIGELRCSISQQMGQMQQQTGAFQSQLDSLLKRSSPISASMKSLAGAPSLVQGPTVCGELSVASSTASLPLIPPPPPPPADASVLRRLQNVEESLVELRRDCLRGSQDIEGVAQAMDRLADKVFRLGNSVESLSSDQRLAARSQVEAHEVTISGFERFGSELAEAQRAIKDLRSSTSKDGGGALRGLNRLGCETEVSQSSAHPSLSTTPALSHKSVTPKAASPKMSSRGATISGATIPSFPRAQGAAETVGVPQGMGSPTLRPSSKRQSGVGGYSLSKIGTGGFSSTSSRRL